jgi:hypothetical protein
MRLKDVEKVQASFFNEGEQHTDLAAPYSPRNLIEILIGGEPCGVFAICGIKVIYGPVLPGRHNVRAKPAAFTRDLGKRVAGLEDGRERLPQKTISDQRVPESEISHD